MSSPLRRRPLSSRMVDLEIGQRWRWVVVGVVALVALVGLGIVLQRAFAPRIDDIHEFVVNSCDRDAMRMFDLRTNQTWLRSDSHEIEEGFAADLLVSGKDDLYSLKFYMMITDDDGYGYEFLDVGREKFMRDPEDPNYPKWVALSWESFPIEIHPYAYGTVGKHGLLVDLCPDFVSAGVQIQGRTTVGSVETLHLRDVLTREVEGVERVNEETGEVERSYWELTDVWEFWIDDSGMLVRTFREQRRQYHTTWRLTEISGVGEPNVITRPATSTVVRPEY